MTTGVSSAKRTGIVLGAAALLFLLTAPAAWAAPACAQADAASCAICSRVVTRAIHAQHAGMGPEAWKRGLAKGACAFERTDKERCEQVSSSVIGQLKPADVKFPPPATKDGTLPAVEVTARSGTLCTVLRCCAPPGP